MEKTMTDPTLPHLAADIRLFGEVTEAMLSEFFRQQAEVQPGKAVVIELSTPGGNADIGRRIADEVRLWRDKEQRDIYFFGKTYVYSAGITIMSAFARQRRFLSQDCELLIHERKLKKAVHLDGALRGCLTLVNDVLAQIESGQRLERDGFSQLITGSTLSLADLEAKVYNREWYVPAAEARALGLVQGLV
jgi:ATP-dependent protease ClpP protease subunit